MTREDNPTGKLVRLTDSGEAVIQTCLKMKVLFGLALRRTTGFVESLLRLINLDWSVSNFSGLNRRQKTLKANTPSRRFQGPLHLLIAIEPASATSFERTGERGCPSLSTTSNTISKSPAPLPMAPSITASAMI